MRVHVTVCMCVCVYVSELYYFLYDSTPTVNHCTKYKNISMSVGMNRYTRYIHIDCTKINYNNNVSMCMYMMCHSYRTVFSLYVCKFSSHRLYNKQSLVSSSQLVTTLPYYIKISDAVFVC